MSSFTPTSIVLFGATGTIGRYITSSLLSVSPPFQRITIFTSLSSLSSKSDLLTSWTSKHPNLAVVAGDLTSESDVSSAYHDSKADTVISCLGRSALDLQIQLLKLAEESETVKWFLPSEYGTDIEHNEKSPNEKPHQLKLKVRKFVRDEIKKVKVTYVVTGPYFDMWVNAHPGFEKAGGFLAEKKEAYVIEDGEGKVGFCTMRDVGKFVAVTLRHPEVAFGKALKVQSFVVTPNQVVSEYEKQTGEKWKVIKTPLEEIRKLEAKAWLEGSPAATTFTLRRIWAEGGTLYEKNDNDVIGMKEGDLDSLEDGVRKALAGGYKKDAF